jgi:hypothetical protein
MLDYDDMGLRFPRTMEQAFGFGRSYYLVDERPKELNDSALKSVFMRVGYALLLVLLAGAAWSFK